MERGTAVPRTSWIIIELHSKLSRQYYCTAFVQWKFIHLWHEGNSSLFEIQLSRHSSRWLSISDQFRPLPRGLLSRLSLRIFLGVQRYWATIVNTYKHLSRLCNHFWLHFPSDTTWVWSRIARLMSALVVKFKVHTTTPTHCIDVFCTITLCVIVIVA